LYVSKQAQLTKAKAAYEAAMKAVDRAFARRSKAVERLFDLGYCLRYPKSREPRIVKIKKLSSAY
jgi:hypothetical protein